MKKDCGCDYDWDSSTNMKGDNMIPAFDFVAPIDFQNVQMWIRFSWKFLKMCNFAIVVTLKMQNNGLIASHHSGSMAI